MFDQNQIGVFKEAFSVIDHDNDGFIDKEDLNDMLSSLGIYRILIQSFCYSRKIKLKKKSHLCLF